MTHPAHARRTNLVRLVAVVAAALAVVAVLIVVSQRGGDDSPSSPPARGAAAAGAAEVTRLFRGIPQDGTTIGSPDAPVTMVEFADLQCPFCAEYDRNVLPTLVERYVRTGRLRMDLRLLRFIGPDSERAAQMAQAAAEQDRLWQFADLFYRNQGTENSGYATDAFLRKLGRATPGLDVERAFAAAPGTEHALRADEAAATSAGIDSTPSFLVGRTDGRLERLEVQALEPGQFTQRLDELLRGR